LELNVDLSFTDDKMRFALANDNDALPGQLKVFDEVMAIASFEGEQARVARKAYRTTLSKLRLKPGQGMIPEIALSMSKEITGRNDAVPSTPHLVTTQVYV